MQTTRFRKCCHCMSCTAMELKFALRKSTSTFSITRCLRIMHYIEQCQGLWSTNCTQQKKDGQHNSEYFKFKLQCKSEDCLIRKNSTSCKQHLKAGLAQHQNITGNYSSFFVFSPYCISFGFTCQLHVEPKLFRELRRKPQLPSLHMFLITFNLSSIGSKFTRL